MITGYLQEGHMHRPDWCDWPNRKSSRGPSDLYKVSARCDAWKLFLQPKTIAKLKKISGSCIYFNKYEYFDKLICEFDCSEIRLRNAIFSLMRKGHELPVAFLREDIYDARAWASLPLDCFTEVDGCNERSGKDRWNHDILKYDEMPVVQFGIKLPWVVSRSCFTLAHKLVEDGARRRAKITFRHPQLRHNFDSKKGRWVGEKIYPRETTRKEMEDDFFAEVKNELAKYLVTMEEE